MPSLQNIAAYYLLRRWIQARNVCKDQMKAHQIARRTPPVSHGNLRHTFELTVDSVLISTRSTIRAAEEGVSVLFTMAYKGFFNDFLRIAYAWQFILFRLEWIAEFPEVPA